MKSKTKKTFKRLLAALMAVAITLTIMPENFLSANASEQKATFDLGEYAFKAKLTHGRKISVGDGWTNDFKVTGNGKTWQGFCGDASKTAPNDGGTYSVYHQEHGITERVLFYGAGGAMDSLTSTYGSDKAKTITHLAISLGWRDDTFSYNADIAGKARTFLEKCTTGSFSTIPVGWTTETYGLRASEKLQTIFFQTATKQYASIVLNKTDMGGKTKLKGAKFSLCSSKSTTHTIKTGTTNASGQITFSGLEMGKTYYIRETEAPSGYALDKTWIEVTTSKTTNTKSIKNEVLPSLVVTKTDSSGKTTLSGASFCLSTSKSTSGAMTATTGSDGKATFKGLSKGKTYYLKETKAPAGYIIDNTWYEVKTSTTSVTNTKSIKNNGWAQIGITKTDAKSKALLAGAKFGIYTDSACKTVATDIDGKKQELTTGSNGYVVSGKLKIATYYLKEIQAPAHYTLDSTVHTVEKGLKERYLYYLAYIDIYFYCLSLMMLHFLFIIILYKVNKTFNYRFSY